MYSLQEPEILKVSPLTITLAVNKSDAQFEVDTGCGVTIMNRSNFAKLGETDQIPELKTCSVNLKT